LKYCGRRFSSDIALYVYFDSKSLLWVTHLSITKVYVRAPRGILLESAGNKMIVPAEKMRRRWLQRVDLAPAVSYVYLFDREGHPAVIAMSALAIRRLSE
jgi:hypothetical protein